MESTTGTTEIKESAKINRNLLQTDPESITQPKSDRERIEAFTIVKRNGMLVPFRRDRIAHAIESAFRGANKIPAVAPLPQSIYTKVQEVADEVVNDVRTHAINGACLTVEGIQDIVEVKLMESGEHEVARGYIVYRDEHKARREDSPTNMMVTRRDGKKVVRFNPMKIASAIERAFRASRAIEGASSTEIIDAVNLLTTRVVARSRELSRQGTQLHIELIQNEIERQMMAEGFYQEAKDFILYRAARAQARKERAEEQAAIDAAQAQVGEVEPETQLALNIENTGQVFETTDAKGTKSVLSEAQLRRRITHACADLANVKAEEIYQDTVRNFYEGIKLEEIDQAILLAARAKVEKDPNYSYATARLLLDQIYRETFAVEASDPEIKTAHAEYFKQYIERGIAVERLSPDLRTFDLERLGAAMDLQRDHQFTYLGLQTLYDRYLIHEAEQRIETPQIFWMRVSMGLAMQDGPTKNDRAIEFYDVLSQFYFLSSTPTLFNAGTLHPQLSSCYLSTVMDDLKHIFKVVQDDAQLSKWAGGLGNDWTNVRATGSRIKGTNGRSQGVIPFLKVANDTAVAVNQGGKRKGAMCAYLETWHMDIEDFLDLRKNTGDDRRRTHDMNTANWIPDLFMKRVATNGSWTLFSPSDVPDLHDLYGRAFDQRYAEYERQTETGEIKLFKKIEAVGLWRKMLSMLFETAHPWITFKDPSNLRSPQDHAGVVHSSNLCTEILLNTSEEETAVCNLGSVNLVKHIDKAKGGLDPALIAKTVRVAIRMLDNVIDINYYPTPEARNANLRHRPVGLGIMGFQDCLYELGLSYASLEAVAFADQSMELISYYAILSSTELAAERGPYQSYKGSKWDRGLLPIDTISIVEQERGGYLEVDRSAALDWEPVREAVRKHGMRNSNTMAIAPTATISNITGITQSIEPTYKHLFAKSNLSGDFIVCNTYLIEELKRRNLWDSEMVDDLKYFDGSILEIERIPDEVKKVYPTAFEIEPEWVIECASRRQKWIDMGQSLNLYIAQPSGKKLHDMYMLAWKKGLKTTYYLRSLGATQVEKSTLDINKRGLQPRWMKNKSASSEIKIDRDPAQEVVASKLEVPRSDVNLDGECEACQ